jgi:methionyl-tRNA formyltransferase
MDKFNFAFFGATNYSKKLLLFLISIDFVPTAIFSIPQEFNISYSEKKVKNSNYADLKEIAQKHNIDYYEVDSIDGKKTKDYEPIINDMNLDLILVLGWYYMIPSSIRNLTKHGAWGIHASLLPKYAGGAPLNWAIINGEKETGVTLFRMDEGVDDGDIIAQKRFDIEYSDSIKEVYERATIVSKELLEEVLVDMKNIHFRKQNKDLIEIYPQRNPKDGEIDLTKSSTELYNFIRAQSNPYPGAYIKTKDGKKLIIEKARVE